MEGERLTVSQIVAEGEFGDDSVRRHLAALQSEIPGVTHEGRRSQRWFYRAPGAASGDGFSVLSIAIASTVLSALRGSEIDERLRRLLARELTHTEGHHTPGDLSRMFFAKSRMINPLGLSPDTVDRLAQAIFEQRLLTVTYEHFDGDINVVRVEPYTLVFADEGLYLYGRCADSDDPKMIDTHRIFNVQRMRGVEMTRDRFPYPSRDEYDPERLFRYCVGVFLPPDEQPMKIVLSFHPRWHSFLRSHRWHRSQTPPRVALDGRIHVTFTLYVTQDLVRWVRSLQPDVEILEPPRLAQWVGTGQDPKTGSRWA